MALDVAHSAIPALWSWVKQNIAPYTPLHRVPDEFGRFLLTLGRPLRGAYHQAAETDAHCIDDANLAVFNLARRVLATEIVSACLLSC